MITRMAPQVVDEAIQVHGAHGVSQDSGLPGMYTGLRTLRVADGPDIVHIREKQIGGSGGSLEPPGPLLEPPGHLHTVYMAYSEYLPTHLNPLAKRTCFSQVHMNTIVKEELKEAVNPLAKELSGHNPYIKKYNKAVLPHGYYDDWAPEAKTSKL